MEIPVYLFTGFLEAGKTRFIQETLEDKRFNAGERTLLLLCEEGEEEYAPDTFAGQNVFIETIEEENDLAATRLAALQKKHRATRVLVEYNGMWMLDSLYRHMPEEWSIYQEFLFVDATKRTSSCSTRSCAQHRAGQILPLNIPMEKWNTTRSRIPCRLI